MEGWESCPSSCLCVCVCVSGAYSKTPITVYGKKKRSYILNERILIDFVKVSQKLSEHQDFTVSE